jgi:hypothetical protein
MYYKIRTKTEIKPGSQYNQKAYVPQQAIRYNNIQCQIWIRRTDKDPTLKYLR